MRYAVIDSGSGLVENVILLDDPTQWPVPDGFRIVQSDAAQIGDAWNGSAFVPQLRPPVSTPPVPPTPRAWLERLAPTTQAAITAAAAKDTTGTLLLWLLKAAGNPSIDVTSAETQAGIASLLAAGLITAADQTTLLAP